jgi:YD repeat-containing protein
LFYYDNENNLVDEYVSMADTTSQTKRKQVHYDYDTLWRLVAVTDEGTTRTLTPVPVASGAVYGPENELLSVSYYNPANATTISERRAYNNRLQLTELYVPGVLDLVYTFPAAGLNNGRITKQVETFSGEEVNYQYDSLNRLIAASTTDASWGLSFNYDAYGNRWSQTVTKGAAPPMSVIYDLNTNHITTSGYAYDANGNLTNTPGGPTLTYDAENRLTSSAGAATYAYGLDSRRVITGHNLDFYSPDGRKLGTYGFNPSFQNVQFFGQGQNFYFGRKLVQANGQLVVTDRGGSVRVNMATGERF